MAKLIVKTRKDRLREAWAAFRAERDRRLAASDWIVARAYERGEPVPAAWAAYRQALRDLPERVSDEQLLSGQIPWPEPPAS
ncbi:phage tail assembly chaperone [Thermus sp. SYSU G05001]|uniref:Phage tail assembly chaperone n=1 Tax=Thermus brevis TaxID=2862456 RepID=A0ABS7A2X1_9DEIN|nr:phage tail assembly chaperone [Thermus brevis]MBW6395554.1 phage tail assembly chaperone [Thermus brevis]